MVNEQRNLELMQTLDDSWNAQDWDTFDKRHRHDVTVRWPAQPPTHGRHDHRAESIRLFKTFPDNRVHNRPYRVLFASGDWTCSIAVTAHPFSTNDQQVASSERIIRASRMAARGLRPLRRPVATIEQRSA